MRSPQYIGNGGTPSPTPQHQHQRHFQSTVWVQKLRRFNTLIMVFRFASFCFSLSCAIFMGTNSNWHHFQAFRYVLAANAIVALYSFLQMGASFWEICTGNTLLPETLQLWFDFGHDQVFAYMVVSADAAGAAIAWGLSKSDEQHCSASTAFCIQSYISIALGFAGFLFLGLSSLLSGFRVVCFIIHGSRFHL